MSDEKLVDCRGLTCPQPVIMTKQALADSPRQLKILVDNAASKENVVKFAAASGYGVHVTESGGVFQIGLLFKNPGATAAVTDAVGPVYLIGRDTLGQGSDELGAILMKAFFVSLREVAPLPKALLFLNAGVRLTVAGSPVLVHLQALAAQGVSVASCGTCLDYYQCKDQLAVGSVTNMFTILTEVAGAGKSITL